MNEKLQPLPKVEVTTPNKVSKPNETGALSIESHVKIFDPNTQEVLVEKRA